MGKLVQVVSITVSLNLPKLHTLFSKVGILMTSKQILQLERILCVYLHDILKRLLENLFWMLHLCVCLDLLHFVLLLRFMVLNATFWFAVTHAIKGNGP